MAPVRLEKVVAGSYQVYLGERKLGRVQKDHVRLLGSATVWYAWTWDDQAPSPGEGWAKLGRYDSRAQAVQALIAEAA